MKMFILSILMLISSTQVFAYGNSVRVKGYTRSNGTYVAPHYRSRSNNTKKDNYSTYGNTNPYTGTTGTKKYESYRNTGSNSGIYGTKKTKRKSGIYGW